VVSGGSVSPGKRVTSGREPKVLRALDAVAARQWADLAVSALAEDQEIIDRINVYPVADGDTGTNLLRTMRSAVESLAAAEPPAPAGVLDALAKGALTGAQGNSGMLVSQVLRGIAEELREVTEIDGAALRGALARAHELAARAVSEPVEGTLLTVLLAAVRGARSCGSNRLNLVVRDATLAAVRALRETPAQLPELAEAGVVDAGGRGLVVLLDTLHAVVCDGERLAVETPSVEQVRARRSGQEPGPGYEVMYLLSESDEERASQLRDALADIGDCISVADDGAQRWAVHVHCDDIGAAIESGIEFGRVHRISVVRFADQTAASPVDVIACAPSEAVAELFRDEGARVVRAGGSVSAADITAAIVEAAAAYVVVLPNGAVAEPAVDEAVAATVRAGREVVVVPTASPVQGLAALAVHDPSRRWADDTVAMAEAAAATRRGELIIASREALTWVGRCQAGDVLGLIDGEVVLIGAEIESAARDLADRMLVPGGELVTALVGDGSPPVLGDELAAHLRRTHPEVEFAWYPGGAQAAVLLLGVE
jgi:DAK2 domain fusion protein YloV